MKILGFHVVRELPRTERVEVRVPVPGPAVFALLYEVETKPQSQILHSGMLIEVKAPKRAYYKTCIAANRAHPGRPVRQVKAIKAGDHYWLGHGPEVEVLKG